jgi:hypothetical protein
MSEWMINPQFEENLIEAFAVPPIRQAFVAELNNRIQQKAEERPGQRSRAIGLLRRPAWAIALTVLTLILVVTLVIGPAKVYAAFLRLFGYIPGVGVVEQGTELRILAEPVQVTRDGITVSVNQVVLTASETKLDYGVAGVPLSAYPREESATGCMDKPYFLLPDGSHVDVFSEAPLPADIDKVAFVLPCVLSTLPDTVPTDWTLLLHFVPAPDDFVMLPVQDVPTQTIESVVPETESTIQTPNEPTLSPVAQVSIEKVIDIEDGYILAGKITQLQEDVSIEQNGGMVLRDADGKKVSSTFVNDINEYELMDIQPGEIPFSFQFKGAGVAFPITITIPGIVLTFPDKEASTTMAFNSGENPQPGQEWQINQPFTLAGHTVILESITADSQTGYSFKFKGDDEVYGVAVEIVNYPGMGGGGSGKGPENEFFRSVAYQTLPSGELTLRMWNLVVTSPQQQWSTTWQPQTVREFQINPQDASVCVNADSFASIADMPAGLDGQVVFTQLNPQMQLMLSDFHGQNQQVLAEGGSRAAVSPDGKQLIYGSEQNAALLNLESGESRQLTNVSGMDFRWSPDGSRIALKYYGDNMGVYVMAADGSALRQLTDLGYESIAGWSPDGSLIYYAIPSASEEGFELMSVDVNSGVSQDVFLLNNSSLKAPIPTISPDGKWVAYRDRNMKSVYIKSMDGKTVRLLLDQPGYALSGIVWDKDSNLLGVGVVTEQNQDGEIILLAPDSCEAYRIPGINGELDGVLIP